MEWRRKAKASEAQLVYQKVLLPMNLLSIAAGSKWRILQIRFCKKVLFTFTYVFERKVLLYLSTKNWAWYFLHSLHSFSKIIYSSLKNSEENEKTKTYPGTKKLVINTLVFHASPFIAENWNAFYIFQNLDNYMIQLHVSTTNATLWSNFFTEINECSILQMQLKADVFKKKKHCKHVLIK